MTTVLAHPRPTLFSVTDSGPDRLPVSVEDVKAQSRIDLNIEDDVIGRQIGTAVEMLEATTRRRIITQTWDMKWDRFPSSGEVMTLTYPPISSVTSVKYVDSNGDEQTWAATKYETSLPTGDYAKCGRLQPVFGEVWPTTRSTLDAVVVRVVAGYGDPGDVPEGLTTGMLLFIGNLFENREATITGTMINKVFYSLDYCWQPFIADF